MRCVAFETCYPKRAVTARFDNLFATKYGLLKMTRTAIGGKLHVVMQMSDPISTLDRGTSYGEDIYAVRNHWLYRKLHRETAKAGGELRQMELAELEEIGPELLYGLKPADTAKFEFHLKMLAGKGSTMGAPLYSDILDKAEEIVAAERARHLGEKAREIAKSDPGWGIF